MEIIIGIPIILFAAILQSAVISRVFLLSGTADLVLVILIAWSLNGKIKHVWPIATFAGAIIGLMSGLPFYLPFIFYGVTTFIARQFHNRIWQTPLLMTFAVTLAASLFQYIGTTLVLQFKGTPITFGEAFASVTLPSILLNLLWSIPIYWVMKELINRLHPEGSEE
jgi:cell shape-determining protein MreD